MWDLQLQELPHSQIKMPHAENIKVVQADPSQNILIELGERLRIEVYWRTSR